MACRGKLDGKGETMNSKSILTIAVAVLLFVFILNGASFAQATKNPVTKAAHVVKKVVKRIARPDAPGTYPTDYNVGG